MARTKGAIGRMNRDMKECIELAFQKSGGIDYLMKVAAEDHKTFCGLLARIVPASVAVSISHKFDLGQAMIDGQKRKESMIDVTPTLESLDELEPIELQPKVEANDD